MRLLELDLFRFIAAMSVVIFHYVAWFVVDNPADSKSLNFLYHAAKYGYLGVPLFFMISGYVILASAFNRNNFEFAVARFARLYPIYWVCLSITAIVVFWVGDYAKNIELFDYIINLTMLQSFVGVGNIDGVYWTLAKELQFYFCIFVLISFGIIKNTKLWVSVWLIATITFTAIKQPFFMGWFISPEYSSFFIAGVCSFLIAKKIDTAFFKTILVLSFPLSAISTFNTSPGFLVEPSNNELYFAILIVAIFYVLFWLLAEGKLQISSKKGETLMWLGALTYPLYLLHNRLGKVMLDYISPMIGEEVAVILTIILMVILSFILVRYFEKKAAYRLKHYLLRQVSKFKLLIGKKA